MRQGQIVADRPTVDHQPPRSWPELMVGPQGPVAARQVGGRVPGEVLLRAEHLTLIDDRGLRLLDDVGLELRAGEIVGIAGVSGNGPERTFADPVGHPCADQRHLDGCAAAPIDARPAVRFPPRCAICGWRTWPEDPRAAKAMVAGLPGGGDRDPWLPRGSAVLPPLLSWTAPAVGAHCAALMERFDVRPGGRAPACARRASPAATSRSSSWRAEDGRASPKVLLVGQPTRRRRHRPPSSSSIAKWWKSRDQGCGPCWWLSVELEEILSLADRILVDVRRPHHGRGAGRTRRRTHAGPDDGGGAARP